MKASLVILPLAAVLLSVPAQAQQRIDLKELLKPYDVKTKPPGVEAPLRSAPTA